MATALPTPDHHADPQPQTPRWLIHGCAGLLAVLGTAYRCPGGESRATTAPPAVAADAALAARGGQLAAAQEARAANQTLIASLARAAADLRSLAGVPNGAFHAYPALQRLHLQWCEAYSQRQQLLETLLPAHPRVQLCLAMEQALQPDLQREVRAALDAARAAQPALDAHVAALAPRAVQPDQPLESQAPPALSSPADPPRSPSGQADPQQRLAELEARTTALARAEQALAAAQARIAATASVPANSVPPAPAQQARPPRVGSLTTGLLAGGLVGLALVLVTARLTSAGAPSTATRPVSTPPACRVVGPTATGSDAQAVPPCGAIEAAQLEARPDVPEDAAAARPTPPAPPAPVVPAVTEPAAPPSQPPAVAVATEPAARPIASPIAPPIASPIASPVSPVVTVPISELAVPPRGPCPRPVRAGAAPHRSPARMTLKQALVRCAAMAGAQDP